MSLLSVKELTQGFGDKTLYKNAAFDIYKGEHIGVVGQNGVGKSTLLNILLGGVVPDEGIIKWQPGVHIGLLDQYAKVDKNQTMLVYLRTAFEAQYAKEQKMLVLYQKGAESGKEEILAQAAQLQEELITADFYEIEHTIQQVSNGLGLSAIGLEKPLAEMSGGQRAKVILAKLLLEKADVLLLDEPTNFLDTAHIEWLAGYLNAFSGAFIIVSHDFDFLEKIATGILDIEFGAIRKYAGRYSEFLHQKTHLRENYIRQYNAQQREIEKTEAYIRKNIAGVNSKNARGRRKQLERMERIDKPEFVQRPTFHFPSHTLDVTKALVVSNLEVGYYYPLLPKLSFSVAGGQKLVISGFNGIGKTTLLKTLLGELKPISGAFQFADKLQIGYYEQDLKWENPRSTPLHIIAAAYPHLHQKEIRRALAQCGVKAEHMDQPITTLSGGEQSKVKLCRLVLCKNDFLILDEPTNHFDAETKEVLQKALAEYKGSLILVSHEPRFYRDWTDKVLDIEKC